MGAELRHMAEAMRLKYARVFGLTRDWIRVEYFEHRDGREDARVFTTRPGHPVWTVLHGGEDSSR